MNKVLKFASVFFVILIYINIPIFANGYIEIQYSDDNNAYFNNLELPYDNFPDPFIFKEGGIYYLYSTSRTPGLQYATSTDLKNWSSTKLCFDNPDRSKYKAFWAPEIYKYNGKYYMLTTAVNYTDHIFDQRLLIAESTSLNSKFTNYREVDVGIDNADVIDGSILFDNGHIYLYYKYEKNGYLYVIELDSSFNKKTEKPTKLIGINKNITWESYALEAPYCIKHNDTYYLMYSTAAYMNETYFVGYATSNSPLGPFVKQTVEKPLLFGDKPIVEGGNKIYDSNNNMYGPGHNMILQISDDEFYTIYHTVVFENNEFIGRKINADKIGFTEDGKMYINGPSMDNQPLPSKENSYYQLPKNQYTIETDNDNVEILNDGINYLCKNVQVDTLQTKNVDITLNKRLDVTDIWLFSNNNGFNNKLVDMYINDEFVMKDICLGEKAYFKMQIPQNSEHIKNLKLKSEEEIELSEITVVTLTDNTKYTLKIDPNDGTYEGSTGIYTTNLNYKETKNILNPTRKGYDFKGWIINGENAVLTGDLFTMGTSNCILTATWVEKIYNVTVDLNGGKTASNFGQKTYDLRYGEKISLEVPEKAGYTFIGWTTNVGKIEGNEFILNDDKDAIITANWVGNTYKYIVYHMKINTNGDGYSIVSEDVETGEAKVGDFISPMPKFYEGFNTTEKKSILIKDEIEKNVIFYCYYRNQYELEIDPNGGLYKDSEMIVKDKLLYEQTIELDNPVRDGYNFLGWEITSGDLVDKKFTIGNENAKLIAKWGKIGNSVDDTIVKEKKLPDTGKVIILFLIIPNFIIIIIYGIKMKKIM